MSLMARITTGGRNLRKFLRETRFELKKVVWPTRRQTINYTLVVIAAVVLVTLLLYLFDSTIRYVFNWLLGV